MNTCSRPRVKDTYSCDLEIMLKIQGFLYAGHCTACITKIFSRAESDILLAKKSGTTVSTSLPHVEPLASAITPPRSFREVILCNSVRLACLTHELGLLRKPATVGMAPSRTLGLILILDQLDRI